VRATSEEQRVGLDAVEAATVLLRRVRGTHPTKGLFEAADLQWRWRTERSTDSLPQLFWFDDHGRPEAAVIATDWGDSIGLDPLVLPDASAEWVAYVIRRGLEHAGASGFATVELEVDRVDTITRDVLAGRGFAIKADGLVETWLSADERPAISPLPDGYRLADRVATASRPHHMIGRSGPAVETRLRQTSLYRPDLDLVVLGRDESAAAYGLFWFDAATATGLVEPMRTEDDHQQRGLARHVLTSGVDRLAEAGATRIKICFEPGNPASRTLYLSVGFRPTAQTDLFSGPTIRATRGW
jgi:GNAT superfamily N-acetyltransferase